MADKRNCEHCKFRAKFDQKPGSLLGRLWRWHAGWCPGFKKYITALPEAERLEIAERYRLKRYGG